jgi:hypothetical protein
MLHCFRAKPTLLIPGCSAAVQFGDQPRSGGSQTRPEYLGKQGVIAVPLPFVVQGHGEQVRSLDLLQHLGSGRQIGILQQGIAQRATQTIQDGRLQQEGLEGLGLALQDFVGQIVQDKVVAPRKAGNELAQCRPRRGLASRAQPVAGR